ncbi:hypothetical protein M422DRAFT_784656 [Sphaerobolus stellatus SS14]|uniref:Cytochrome P450 n=1 Tax=Sphaerobolus stellatus (strain SS14) TaxID=990650 RepID=A0A0C9U1W5_SPHS4|nr:hypothetical protein M422DRAFT_784656 [Sphaerobolus stellatus SS14]
MTNFSYLSVALAFLFILYGSLKKIGTFKWARPPLPPGPKPRLLIGNYLDRPKNQEWLTLDEWFRVYGDLVYYRIFGQGVLVLGSMKRCQDLLDKRSRVYSSRPRQLMLNELCGWEYALVTLGYGNPWRKRRQAFNQYFNKSVTPKYRPVQLKGARGLLHRLVDHPDINLTHNVRRTIAEIILGVIYGYKVAAVNDPFIEITEQANEAVLECAKPGKFLVEVIPILKNIPYWFPGARFKRLAKKWKSAAIDMVEKPFEWTKDEMAKGRAKDSIVASMVMEVEKKSEKEREGLEQVFKDTAGIASAAGTDTTVSLVMVFLLAMTMYPDVQRKAQKELDSVLGAHRLPDFGDRDSLPYVKAIVKETMRWQNVVPLNPPHMTTEEDIYEGYYIPKGTLVIASIWSILHNPAIYPDPLEFKPERFIEGKFDGAMLDPYLAVFGYGRRICPGRDFGDDSAFIIIASILATLDISPPPDETGRAKVPTCEMQSGIVSSPEPFECCFKPRSSVAAQLIHDAISHSNLE